jgi:hypothetical protein
MLAKNLTLDGESLTVMLEVSDNFVVLVEDGNEEGVDFYINLGNITKSWGKKGLSYAMLNDNLVGYA